MESSNREIPPENYFWVRNGVIIKNLAELRTAIAQMDDFTFGYHVNDNKNDFSDWIRYVIGNERLASRVAGKISKEGMISAIEEELRTGEEGTGEELEDKPNQTYLGSETDRNPNVDSKKIEEILMREKEIEKKEEKIKEIEGEIEKRLEEMKKEKDSRFFSKEFVQGIIVGVLLAVAAVLVYIKFFL